MSCQPLVFEGDGFRRTRRRLLQLEGGSKINAEEMTNTKIPATTERKKENQTLKRNGHRKLPTKLTREQR